MPLEVVPYTHSLCSVDGMYGGDIDDTTWTVGFEAMTALERDGSALIPASLVNVQKGILCMNSYVKIWREALIKIMTSDQANEA